MNWKTVGLQAAAVAVASATVAAAPAEAGSLRGTIDLVGTQQVNIQNTLLDFGSNGAAPGSLLVVGATGGLASFDGQTGSIKDLSRPAPTAAQKTGFLSIGSNLFFDLSTVSFAEGPVSGNFKDFNISVAGVFRNSSRTALGDGLFTAQLKKDLSTGKSSYSASLRAIPTPALLPGLIGLGVSAWRKRKQDAALEPEEAATEA